MHHLPFPSSHRRATLTATVLLSAITALIPAAGPSMAAEGQTRAAALPTHSRLTAISPKDGATVNIATEVVLTFNENVDPNFALVSVTGPDGTATKGKPKVNRGIVTQTLAPQLARGQYSVLYRVVSTDGHPVSGKTSFRTTGTLSAAPSSASAASSTATPTDSPGASSSSSPSVSPNAATPGAAAARGTGTSRPLLILIGLIATVAAGAMVVSLRRRWRAPTSSRDST